MPLGVEHELGRVTGFIEEAEDLVVIGRLRVTRQPRPPMATRDGAEHVATPVRHQRLAAVSTVHVRVTGRHIASARAVRFRHRRGTFPSARALSAASRAAVAERTR